MNTYSQPKLFDTVKVNFITDGGRRDVLKAHEEKSTLTTTPLISRLDLGVRHSTR
jgi:hypothetical protein